MSILRRAFGGATEHRIIDRLALWGQGVDIGTPTHAGVEVTADTALRLSAVWRCVNLRASTIAGLPVSIYRTQGEDRVEIPRPPAWLYQPNPEMTWFQFIERITSCLDIDGNAFIVIGDRFPPNSDGTLGYPRTLWPVNPQRLEIRRRNGEMVFEYDGGAQVFTRYSYSNQGGNMLHIAGFANYGDRGMSPIEVARQAIGLGLVAEKFGARFFGSGQQMSGLIKMPPGPEKQVEGFIDMIRRNWTSTYGGSDQSHLPGVLINAEWVPLTIPPDQAQFLETRKFQVRDIARMFGIPPHKIGDLEQATFSNIEHQAIEFVTDAILPTVRRLEQALDQLTPGGQYLKFGLNGLLRGDTQSRFAAYASAIQNGWMSRNEVRHLEDLNSEDGLDEYLQLGTLITVDEAAAKADAAASPTTAPTNGQAKFLPVGAG